MEPEKFLMPDHEGDAWPDSSERREEYERARRFKRPTAAELEEETKRHTLQHREVVPRQQTGHAAHPKWDRYYRSLSHDEKTELGNMTPKQIEMRFNAWLEELKGTKRSAKP